MRRNHRNRMGRFLMALSASILPDEQAIARSGWPGPHKEAAAQLLVIGAMPPAMPPDIHYDSDTYGWCPFGEPTHSTYDWGR
jgi:hypothetical protein